MQIAKGPQSSPTRRPELLRIVVLALVSALIWCAVEDRWNADTWKTPVEYYTDPGAMDIIALFATVKAASQGYYVPFASKLNPLLGAPFVANWNDYPNNEQIQPFLTGLLANGTGIFAATNFLMLTLCVLAALSFYFVCRQFRCPWPWAFAGGLVYAFAQFAFAHGEHHLTVSAYWHVPLMLLVCRWALTGGGLRWRGWRFRFAMVVAMLAGMQNVYYAAMFIQLLGLGCVVRFFRGRRKALLPALAIGAATMATFLLMNLNTFVFHIRYGANHSAVARSYEELEWTAMRFSDFFMPWQHRIPAFEAFAKHYYTGSYVRGENPPANYFGIVGIIALAWFLVALCRRVLGRPPRPISLDALQFLWIFVFSIVGGVNGILGLTGFMLFRATARYSIFLLCIVLLFLIRKLSKLTVASPVMARALPVAMAALAVWDQTPKWKSDADIAKTEALVDSDRSFTEAMESRLPANAMVFEVPAMDFPEDANSKVMPSYEHFRPYLFSEKLRYSFGNDKGRPPADWQHKLAGVPIQVFVSTLRQYGFAAVFINRKGMDGDGAYFLDQLRSVGLNDGFQSTDGDLVCVFLPPARN